MDLDTQLFRQLLGDLSAAEIAPAAMKIADPLDRLVRHLQWTRPTRLAIAQPGHTARFERGERGVERLSRKAEILGDGNDTATFDEMNSQHLVLDLDLVERIEEPLLLEESRSDSIRMTVQGAVFLENLAFGVTFGHRPPPR